MISISTNTFFRSNVCKDTQAPKWKEAVIDIDDVKSKFSVLDEPIFFDVYVRFILFWKNLRQNNRTGILMEAMTE